MTTGTKAWELFQDKPEVIAARIGGELRDLAHELAEGDEVEGVTPREDQAVTTGTKAWQLFQDKPEVIAARIGGDAARPGP